ncbi:MAG: hypothetical protein ABIL76_09330, partial [candidate division WOR-3 bacterium]
TTVTFEGTNFCGIPSFVTERKISSAKIEDVNNKVRRHIFFIALPPSLVRYFVIIFIEKLQ